MPNEALFRNESLKEIERVFQSFGFLTIDTPTFESLKVLKAKGGIGEDSKLIFEMTTDDVGLRYDWTVSLARYVAMHQNLPLPFKRYAIGKAWRREEPQRLRYREFTQADVDIVGGRSSASDAEILGAVGLALDGLELDYTVLVNDRRFMDGLLESIGIREVLWQGVMRSIDKLDKIGRDGVMEQLQTQGLNRDQLAKIDSLINMEDTNENKLDYVGSLLNEQDAVDEMRGTLDLLKAYKMDGKVKIDFSIVRGLDYYTGIVFEFKANGEKTKSTIAAGGRYDKLIGMLSGRQVPAVGCSIGVDRALEVLGFSDSTRYTYASVYVANIKDDNYPYALAVANRLRDSGIAVDLNSASRNISNQLAYANSLKFRYALIVGDAEEKALKVKFRDLIDGSENTMALEDAVKIIKKGVNVK